MWLTAIPVVGDVIKAALSFASKRWGYNPKEQEIDELTQEVLSQGNVLQAVQRLYDVIVEYEGKASVVPKAVLYLRCTWRPFLQWGLTVKLMMGLFLQGKSIEEMKATIAFVAGLAVLRELGKKLKTKEEA